MKFHNPFEGVGTSNLEKNQRRSNHEANRISNGSGGRGKNFVGPPKNCGESVEEKGSREGSVGTMEEKNIHNGHEERQRPRKGVRQIAGCPGFLYRGRENMGW